ncbi:hypothetical protein [Microbacterium sp. SS28]|uniref:hypothetical protein n=1 Tax=Microbacterium sp. SS28 TaxID=2919948 RepID=UPI001FAA4CF6|nr:hypothetical protein [Microbacterium sp. SS28]
MSWTLDPGDAQSPGERLAAARDAFREARHILEDARADLLRTHAETARLWHTGR